MISSQMISTFVITLVIVLVYSKVLFKDTVIASVDEWKNVFWQAFFLNVVLYASLAAYFSFKYGWIVDDVNYFYGAEGFPYTPIYKLKNGNEFMFFVVKPFRDIFDMDKSSFHIMYGGIGFIGSLNFAYVMSKRVNIFTEPALARVAFFLLLCFPNFLAWGRFFGKDCLMLFFSSILTVCYFNIISGSKRQLVDLCTIVILLYLMQIIRPHVAGVIALSLIGGYIVNLWKFQAASTNVGLRGLVRIFIPIFLLLLGIIIGLAATKKLAIKQDSSDAMSMDVFKATVVNSTRQGAFGGSVTDLASEMSDNPDIIFTPNRILKNIVNLLFAPFPWQINGVSTLIALLSNIIFAVVLIRHYRNIQVYDPFQYFLLFMSLGLIFLLSFMTANVGLILRQKTIILPFLFILIFSRNQEQLSEEEEEQQAVEPAY